MLQNDQRMLIEILNPNVQVKTNFIGLRLISVIQLIELNLFEKMSINNESWYTVFFHNRHPFVTMARHITNICTQNWEQM